MRRKETPSSKLILPILIIVLGGFCMLAGIGLLVARLADPAGTTSLILPVTDTPIPPTAGFLLSTHVAPPPRQAEMPIMPVMAVAVLDTPFPTPTATFTPTATSTISPTFTLTPSQTTSPTRTPSLQPEMIISFHTTEPQKSPTPSVTPSATFTSTFTATPTNTPTATVTPTITPTAIPRQPDRILIPAINVDAPIVKVWLQRILIDNVLYSQWGVPEGWAVGWHETSAMLGQAGNTVLNGHHNIEGRVFRHLVDVQPGDRMTIISKDGYHFEYIIVQTMLLPEEDQPMEQRLENARWLLPSNDERITMVSCYPPTGRTHRLVVIALPADAVEGED